jgi:hypothetical protein
MANDKSATQKKKPARKSFEGRGRPALILRRRERRRHQGDQGRGGGGRDQLSKLLEHAARELLQRRKSAPKKR